MQTQVKTGMLFHVIFMGRLEEHNLIAASIKCLQNLSRNCSENSQLNITVKSTNNGLSAFIWKLDHNPILFTVFKHYNDGVAGTLTQYANCTKTGSIENSVGQYPFYSVIYSQMLCFQCLQSKLYAQPCYSHQPADCNPSLSPALYLLNVLSI